MTTSWRYSEYKLNIFEPICGAININCAFDRNRVCACLAIIICIPCHSSGSGCELNKLCLSAWWCDCHLICNVCLSTVRWILCEFCYDKRYTISSNSVGLGDRICTGNKLVVFSWFRTWGCYGKCKLFGLSPSRRCLDCPYYNNCVTTSIKVRISLPCYRHSVRCESDERCGCTRSHSHSVDNVGLSANDWIFTERCDDLWSLSWSNNVGLWARCSACSDLISFTRLWAGCCDS